MIPADLEQHMTPSEVETIVNGLLSDKTAFLSDVSTISFSYTLFQYNRVLRTTQWVSRFSELPKEFELRGYTGSRPREYGGKIRRNPRERINFWVSGLRLRIGVRFWPSWSLLPAKILYSFVPTSQSNGKLYPLYSVTPTTANKLLSAHAWTYRRSAPWTRSSGRPNPEEIVSVFPGWVRSETGVVSLPVEFVSYHRDYTSTTTPGFHSVRRKRLPENPHTVNISRKVDNGLFQYARYYNTPYFEARWRPYFEMLGTSGYGSDRGKPDDTNVRNAAISKLATRSNAGVQNLAETVATLPQLNRLIVNNTLKIVRSMRSLRRGNFSKAISYLWTPQRTRVYRRKPSFTRDLANNWLELQYGWKPLLQDIDFAVGAVARFNHADYSIKGAKASRTLRVRYYRQMRQSDGYFSDYATGHELITYDISSKFGLQHALTDGTVQLLAQSGFLNPISLAWELLPFSFVVDWFLPLGPYLESLTQWVGLSFLKGYEVNFMRKRRYFSVDFENVYQPGPNQVIYGANGSHFTEDIVFSRSPLTGFPNPTFPSFKNPFSMHHSLNALALLRTVFGK